MRIHLTALVKGVLTPRTRVNATSDLGVVGSDGVVGTEDVAWRRGGSQRGSGAIAVDGSASLVGGNVVDTLTREHGAESHVGSDGCDHQLGAHRLSGASNRLESKSGGRKGGNKENRFHEHD